jgi:hypothetical protein
VPQSVDVLGLQTARVSAPQSAVASSVQPLVLELGRWLVVRLVL